MFWAIYIFFSISFSYLLSKFLGKTRIFLFFLSLIIMITPAQTDIGLNQYSPALFTFLLNILFERDFSFRVSRPLMLSLPLGLVTITLIFFSKKILLIERFLVLIKPRVFFLLKSRLILRD